MKIKGADLAPSGMIFGINTDTNNSYPYLYINLETTKKIEAVGRRGNYMGNRTSFINLAPNHAYKEQS